jgi:hypothetical protein
MSRLINEDLLRVLQGVSGVEDGSVLWKLLKPGPEEERCPEK